MQRVTGIGGVFIKANDDNDLAALYYKQLGFLLVNSSNLKTIKKPRKCEV